MGSRGRESAADLAIVPVAPRLRRPPPPDDLTKEQAAEWRAVVGRMPAGWFEREHFAILADYCRHVTRSRFLAAGLERCKLDDLMDSDGLDHFNKMAAAAERETRAMLACARSLRITHQAQIRPETAARRAQRARSGPAPWEDAGWYREVQAAEERERRARKGR